MTPDPEPARETLEWSAASLAWYDDRWRHELRSEGHLFLWTAQDTVSRKDDGSLVDVVNLGLVPGGVYAAVRALLKNQTLAPDPLPATAREVVRQLVAEGVEELMRAREVRVLEVDFSGLWEKVGRGIPRLKDRFELNALRLLARERERLLRGMPLRAAESYLPSGKLSLVVFS